MQPAPRSSGHVRQSGPATHLERSTLIPIEHHATNNLGAQAAELLYLTDLEPGTYLNQFHCVPAAAPIVPAFARKPTAPQVQTALVVGLAGEALTTERDHRVKVQFAWQRGERPNAGGLAHASAVDTKGNAPGNEQAGTWVRVAQPAAGANWGAVYTPRIGTEVAIGFVDGDIDRPVVLGQLYLGRAHAEPGPGGRQRLRRTVQTPHFGDSSQW